METKTPEQELDGAINKALLDYVSTIAEKQNEAFLTRIGTLAVTKAVAEIMKNR